MNKINASPSKGFFISMISRDINVNDAILELVDNSVDSAIKHSNSHIGFNDYRIKITISGNMFVIDDNCGGMSLNTAINQAFTFGRQEDAERIDFSTGVFGIGMKRALFKMGRKFRISSCDGKHYFEIDIDVDDWEKDEKWNFEFRVVEDYSKEKHLIGTKIEITNLYEGIKTDFESYAFLSELESKYKAYLASYLEKGLQVMINGIKIMPSLNSLIKDENCKPVFEEFSRVMNGTEVKVGIVAGMSDKGFPDDAGWYIYCNNRLIVVADKSNKTGWEEDNTPKFHPTYARFRGFVFFESKDARNLPWNTTKTGIDTSSPIYIAAKKRMKTAFAKVSDVLKKIKNIESEQKREEVEEIIDSMEKCQVSVSNYKEITTGLSSEFVTKFTEFPKKSTNPEVNISYKRIRSDVTKVMSVLGVESYRSVGELTFQYFFDRECN